MIRSAALALLIGSIFSALTVAAKLGPASGLLVAGVTLVTFTVSEAVRKHNPGAQ